MRIALYARVSLDESAGDKRYQEPENQLQPLRDFAKALGAETSIEYIDKASGANPARPQFRQMMNDALARQFSGIIVWKLDRFSREGIIPTMAYIKQLKERGIFLKSLTESWLDTQNEGITDVVLAIMAWAAAEERKKISERTRAGIARRRAIGQWRGGRPKKTALAPVITRDTTVKNDEKPKLTEVFSNGRQDTKDSDAPNNALPALQEHGVSRHLQAEGAVHSLRQGIQDTVKRGVPDTPPDGKGA